MTSLKRLSFVTATCWLSLESVRELSEDREYRECMTMEKIVELPTQILKQTLN